MEVRSVSWGPISGVDFKGKYVFEELVRFGGTSLGQRSAQIRLFIFYFIYFSPFPTVFYFAVSHRFVSYDGKT